jgi:hypothetical protein
VVGIDNGNSGAGSTIVHRRQKTALVSCREVPTAIKHCQLLSFLNVRQGVGADDFAAPRDKGTSTVRSAVRIDKANRPKGKRRFIPAS